MLKGLLALLGMEVDPVIPAPHGFQGVDIQKTDLKELLSSYRGHLIKLKTFALRTSTVSYLVDPVDLRTPTLSYLVDSVPEGEDFFYVRKFEYESIYHCDDEMLLTILHRKKQKVDYDAIMGLGIPLYHNPRQFSLLESDKR